MATIRGNTFGPTLGEYLKFRSIKQKVIAKAAALSQSNLSKIINGYHGCDADDAHAITQYLGVTIEFIMNEGWKK